MYIDIAEDSVLNKLQTQKRKTLWEIEDYMVCPVIGTCLTLSEQKKILKKAGVSIAGLTDYDIHGKVVGNAKSENPVSIRVNSCLEKKFRQKIIEAGVCSEKTFLSSWRSDLKNGYIEDLLWVGVTNPNLSKKAVAAVFADVHMLMHHQGSLVRQKLRQITHMLTENETLTVKLRDTQKRAQMSAAALYESQNIQKDLECKFLLLQSENEVLKDSSRNHLNDHNKTLSVRLEKAEKNINFQTGSIEQLKMENDCLSDELDTQVETNRLIQSEINNLLIEMRQKELECKTCPNYDLCDMNILLVGGIAKLSSLYRKVVENVGGEFKYHEGHNSGGDRTLQNLINWADVILFPVDINSHNASLGVKKICKRMQKPYHILNRASISSFARALENVAQTR